MPELETLLDDITLERSGSVVQAKDDGITYAKMQNVSATSRIIGRKTAAAGDPEECTLSEVLDFVGSAAQGDILYRGAATWARLGAGTSGHYLKTQGAGANPTWAAVASTPTFQGCRLTYTLGNQSISNNSWTSLAFNSESYDTDGFHDNSTNNSRITVPSGLDGKYRLLGSFEFATGGAAGTRRVRLLKNGTDVVGPPILMPYTTTGIVLQVAAELALAATDYVELQAFQDSGGAVNVVQASDYSPRLCAQFLGA
jgi:hypothetical protein